MASTWLLAHCWGSVLIFGDIRAGLWQLSSLTSLRCLDVSGCINVDPYRALHFLRVRLLPSSRSFGTDHAPV